MTRCLSRCWRRSPSWRRKLARRRKPARLQQAARRLALASPVAVAIAVELLKSPDAAIQLRAAFGILNRAGIETAVKSSSLVVGETTLTVRPASELSTMTLQLSPQTAAAELLRRRAARIGLLAFTQYTFPGYVADPVARAYRRCA